MEIELGSEKLSSFDEETLPSDMSCAARWTV